MTSHGTCGIEKPHCQNCGSTSYEDLHTGDDGYTACCNEPVEYYPCSNEHN